MSPVKKHSIAVITGSRAEYGLLRPVLFKLAESKLDLKLVVTGSHLSSAYGNTVTEIESDGLPIAAKIDILKFQDTPNPVANTVAYTILAFSDWFSSEKPDCVLVLGDRYEIFAAVQAAAMSGIPVAHISGGDITLGASDEYYRHCITKIASLHFPSCRDSYERLLRMGEQPATVFLVGGLGDENIRKLPKMTADELSKNLSFDLASPFGLVTFHPETGFGHAEPLVQLKELLSAMDEAHASTGLRYLITKSNADQGGSEINEIWDKWSAERKEWALTVTSLGVKRYLSAMSIASVVIGNSSSGVVETPTFGVPTVNIGKRQEGRIICDNVISVDADKTAILDAIKTCLTLEFSVKAHCVVSPYFGEDPSGSMVKILEDWVGDPALKEPKRFYDAD